MPYSPLGGLRYDGAPRFGVVMGSVADWLGVAWRGCGDGLRRMPLGACALCRMGCGAGEGLCGHCRDALVRNRNACRGCALPLPLLEDGVCGGCLARRRWPLDGVVAPYLYDEPLDGLIIDFKHRARPDMLRALLPPLVRSLAEQGWERPQLVPVPLHWRRLWRRGFNQSLLIARALGAQLGWPVAGQVLRRHRHTVPQQGLNRAQRRRNVRGAFALRGAPPGVAVLVDDVMTTGATAEAAAAALRARGAEQVYLCALARAGGPR